MQKLVRTSAIIVPLDQLEIIIKKYISRGYRVNMIIHNADNTYSISAIKDVYQRTLQHKRIEGRRNTI